jgi:hypothetical protein
MKGVISDSQELIVSEEIRKAMHSLIIEWLPSVFCIDTVSSIFSSFLCVRPELIDGDAPFICLKFS